MGTVNNIKFYKIFNIEKPKNRNKSYKSTKPKNIIKDYILIPDYCVFG